MAESDVRYIVVAFYQGIGYTLQEDDKIHIFFHHYPKSYKKLGNAINAAKKVNREYFNETTCVFKTKLEERLSCDQYDQWYKDKERVMWDATGCSNYKELCEKYGLTINQ